jgi:hypothetical protein
MSGVAWIAMGTIEVPSAGAYTVEASRTKLQSSDAPVLGFRARPWYQWYQGGGGWTQVASDSPPLCPIPDESAPTPEPRGPSVMGSPAAAVGQGVPEPPSAADQLAQLTRLRDAGHISEKVFQQSKENLARPKAAVSPRARAIQIAALEKQRDRGKLSDEQFETIKARLLDS